MADLSNLTTGVDLQQVKNYQTQLEDIVKRITTAIDNHQDLDAELAKNWSGASYDQFAKDFAEMVESVKAQINGQLVSLNDTVVEIAEQIAATDRALAEAAGDL